MTNTISGQPDLDWSQVKETIKLLTVSVVMVQRSMEEGDSSVTVLAESFAAMADNIRAIQEMIGGMADGEQKQQTLQHCQMMETRIQSSIMAFQFYDRLQQCLEHVVHNLDGLSSIIGDPQRFYNPFEWGQIQQSIRNRYTMASERAMFDAILSGKSVEEAIRLAKQADEEVDSIELF